MRSLASAMSGLTLPDMVFFTPTQAFLDWLDEQEGQVIDAGAGVGLLGELRPRILSFDVVCRENPRCTIHPIDTTDFPYAAGCTVIMARPSAGDWIHATWRQVLDRGGRMFYVGLAKNYERDLTGVQHSLVLSDAGLDGEELFEITALQPETE